MKEVRERILVIGAGVNGSVCASVLHDGGFDVKILARGRRYEEILSEGIIIENPFNYKRRTTKVKAINTLLPDDLYDYILVIVRKNQVKELLPVLSVNHSRNIVFMGNNLAGPDEFIKALGRDRVMMGFVFAGGKREGNIIKGIVIKSISVPFGEIDGTISPRLTRLIHIMREAGFKAKLPPVL